MNKKIVETLATFFYIGYFPVGSGTVASAAGVLIWFLVWDHPFIQIFLIGFITYLGFLVGGSMEKISGKKDPGCVVIDEVAGVLIAFFLLPMSWPVVITAFFLFRAFDMSKIYPANKLEQCEGSFGIMTDDLVAGVYTNIIMQIACRWAWII